MLCQGIEEKKHIEGTLFLSTYSVETVLDYIVNAVYIGTHKCLYQCKYNSDPLSLYNVSCVYINVILPHYFCW